MKREQWILANQVSNAVINLNAVFCEDDGDVTNLNILQKKLWS